MNTKEKIGVAEIKNRLSEVIGKVSYGGYRFIIEKRGKPRAAVIAYEDLENLERLEQGLSKPAEKSDRLLREMKNLRNQIKKRRGVLSDSGDLIREIREERNRA
jgi:prevent-host-death family protein